LGKAGVWTFERRTIAKRKVTFTSKNSGRRGCEGEEKKEGRRQGGGGNSRNAREEGGSVLSTGPPELWGTNRKKNLKVYWGGRGLPGGTQNFTTTENAKASGKRIKEKERVLNRRRGRGRTES